MGEFDLIRQFFDLSRGRSSPNPAVALGIGDDCALLQPVDGQLAVSTDTLVAGRHFFADVDPRSLGHKALAVNLSDLAAMGAKPVACVLAIALPKADPAWLAAFSQGFLALAERAGCPLVGGDTVRMMPDGPATLTVTVLGQVPVGQALRRDVAKVGDLVWVSGELGDARLALSWRYQSAVPELLIEADRKHCERRLDWPEPRLALGLALRGLAHAAMDLSDGLAGDVRHIMQRSGVGVELALDALPASQGLARLPAEQRYRLAAAGGDDYELLFTAAPAQTEALLALSQQLSLRLTPIGRVVAGDRLVWLNQHGEPVDLAVQGFDHFG